MATQLQKLIAALRGTPQPPSVSPNQMPGAPAQTNPQMPQLGGIAGQGQGIMAGIPQYRQYAIEKQTNGEQPVPFEEFMKGAR